MARCIFQIYLLIIHMWLSPLISSNTNENIPVCISTIMVPRNTVWNVHATNSLKINCTVKSEKHCQYDAYVSWCRIDDRNVCSPLNNSTYTTTNWTRTLESEGLFFLTFQNISMRDAGLYRCTINSPTPTVSHTINVTVTEYFPDATTTDYKVGSQENNTNSSNPVVGNKQWLPSYIYICSGIGVLLFIVGVVSIIVIRCPGQKRSNKQKMYENQSAASPVADLAPPIYKPRESPRSKAQTLPALLSPPPPCIYDTPPVRGRCLRDRSSAGRHPVDHAPQRQCHDHGTEEEEEEENPLIYATLNHEPLPQRPVRVAHVQIEESEYAAIKVT